MGNASNSRSPDKAATRTHLKTMSNAAPVNKILLVILAFLLPPLAVGLHSGLGKNFIINLILTLIFWLPGVIHALIVIL